MKSLGILTFPTFMAPCYSASSWTAFKSCLTLAAYSMIALFALERLLPVILLCLLLRLEIWSYRNLDKWPYSSVPSSYEVRPSFIHFFLFVNADPPVVLFFALLAAAELLAASRLVLLLYWSCIPLMDLSPWETWERMSAGSMEVKVLMVSRFAFPDLNSAVPEALSDNWPTMKFRLREWFLFLTKSITSSLTLVKSPLTLSGVHLQTEAIEL